MPFPQYKSLREIADSLNNKEPEGSKGWIDTEQYLSLPGALLENGKVKNAFERSIIVRFFFNEKNGDCKFFLAKSITDIADEDKQILG